MTTLERSRQLLSLADVAALAGVQRPVVSVWRARSTGSHLPFPEAVTEQEHERFDADTVVDWLEQTGRGNNSSPREDVAAFAFVNTITAEDDAVHAFEGLTALLCLKVITGRALAQCSPSELRDLADEADPDDVLLFREVAGLADRLASLARYADLLADAAYNPTAAFEKLMTARFRGHLTAQSSVTLAGPVVSLAGSLAVELARGAGIDPPVFADPTPGGSDLLLATVQDPALNGSATVLTNAADDTASRLARRRLRAHDIHRESFEVADDGEFELWRPATLVAHYPGPGSPAMDHDEILTAIDNLALQMDDAQRAVVIAPAAVLVDGHRGKATEQRDGLLRLGRVRGIVRLPAGLVIAKSRQALGLWVLGPAHELVPIEDRWTVVADLSNVRLDAGVTQDLVTDLVAAMGNEAMVRAHAFRFAHLVPTRTLLAASGSLVGGATVATTPHASSSAVAVRIAELAAALTAAGGGTATRPLIPEITALAGGDTGRRGGATVGQAVSQGALRMIPGNRIDRDDVSPTGAVVLGPGEVTGASPLGQCRIDPLTFAGYDTGRYTEPGDVVFTTSPHPAALVDREGGSVVAFPARVLRITASRRTGLLPEILAADVNSTDPEAKSWRLWPIRRVPAEQVEPMRVTMTRLAGRRTALRDELARLDELAEAVTDGVTRGAVALMPQTLPNPPKETRRATAQKAG